MMDERAKDEFANSGKRSNPILILGWIGVVVYFMGLVYVYAIIIPQRQTNIWYALLSAFSFCGAILLIMPVVMYLLHQISDEEDIKPTKTLE